MTLEQNTSPAIATEIEYEEPRIYTAIPAPRELAKGEVVKTENAFGICREVTLLGCPAILDRHLVARIPKLDGEEMTAGTFVAWSPSANALTATSTPSESVGVVIEWALATDDTAKVRLW